MTYSGGLIGRGSILAATGAAICASLLGCGGGAGDDGPSMAAFLERAEAICKKARAVSAKSFARHDGENLSAALSTALNEEADDIAALDRPSEHTAQIETLIDRVRETADSVEAGNDVINKVERAAEKAERWADALELEECFVY